MGSACRSIGEEQNESTQKVCGELLRMSSNKIDKRWRNYTTDNDLQASKFNKALRSHESGNQSSVNSKNIKGTMSNGGRMPPRTRFKSSARKYLGHNVSKKFKANQELDRKLLCDSMGKMNRLIREFDTMHETYELEDFRNDIDMHRNLNAAKKGKFELDTSSNKRLATEFARLIGKIAEDLTGEPEPGDEYWDIDRLLNRRLSKESILNCKMTRERESIIMILDSSPSCHAQAVFYSELASIATVHGDVELYNAPNARLVEMYNARKKKFVPFLTPYDLMDRVHKWSLFKNRVILFFGDNDGEQIVLHATENNDVYWFDWHKYVKHRSLARHKRAVNSRNLKLFYSMYNKEDFINTMKKIRR